MSHGMDVLCSARHDNCRQASPFSVMKPWNDRSLGHFLALLPVDAQQITVFDRPEGTPAHIMLGVAPWHKELTATYIGAQPMVGPALDWSPLPDFNIVKEHQANLHSTVPKRASTIIMPQVLDGLKQTDMATLVDAAFNHTGEQGCLIIASQQRPGCLATNGGLRKALASLPGAITIWAWEGRDEGSSRLSRLDSGHYRLVLDVMKRQEPRRWIPLRHLLACLGLFHWMQEYTFTMVHRP